MRHATFVAVALAGLAALGTTTDASAATQVLTFSGTLQNGYNQGGPFAGSGFTDLTNRAYSISISYDSALFAGNGAGINSCGTVANTSCSFFLSATRTLTENITLNGVSRTYVYTTGNFALNSGGNDQFDFNVADISGNSFSGSLSDTNSFYPNQNSVNNPVFSSFTNLAIRGNFTQFGTGYSIGANPTQLTANAVPEPAAWMLMVGGFGMVGAAARARRRVGTTAPAR